MKKTLLILMLALALTLPLLSLAENAAAPEAEAATQAPVQETTTPPLGQHGRRWRQTLPEAAAQPDAPAQPAVPGFRFADENNDGVCDLCGNKPGKNTQAPGFVDENNDGVCDHFGTTQQGPHRMGNRPMGCRRMRSMKPGMRRNMPGNRFAPNTPSTENAPFNCPNFNNFNNRNVGPGRNRR